MKKGTDVTAPQDTTNGILHGCNKGAVWGVPAGRAQRRARRRSTARTALSDAVTARTGEGSRGGVGQQRWGRRRWEAEPCRWVLGEVSSCSGAGRAGGGSSPCAGGPGGAGVGGPDPAAAAPSG